MNNVDLPKNLILSSLRQLKEKDESLFLVGGSVRDFLLHRDFKDYDFLGEGDVFSFVVKLKKTMGGKVVFNKRLLTANLQTNNINLDFATARKEYYSYPGALPQITPATWQEDLQRRDFTINALAIPFLEDGWGQVIDLLHGQEDLASGLIRILHEQSFRDDPTRILRAIRYHNRLDFSFEEKTLQKLKQSWGYLKNVSPRRRLKEWQLLCTEKTMAKNIQDLYILGGWSYFMGGLSFTHVSEQIALMPNEQLPQGMRPWYLYLLIFLIKEPHKLEDISAYWGLSPQEKEELQRVLLCAQKLTTLRERQLWRELQALPREGVYYLFRKNPQWGESWENFSREILAQKMPIQGRDLLLLGLKQGPEVGKLLQSLEEYYDQELFQTKKEGLKLAKQLIKEEFNE